jgi:hypothetical protein
MPTAHAPIRREAKGTGVPLAGSSAATWSTVAMIKKDRNLPSGVENQAVKGRADEP